jgi:hypothetical protein
MTPRYACDNHSQSGFLTDVNGKTALRSIGKVYAIKACIAENLDRNYRHRIIYILSDSQTVINALSNHWITSKLVWDCHQPTTPLAEHSKSTNGLGARS